MATQELGANTITTYSGTISVWDDPAGIGMAVSGSTTATTLSVVQKVTYANGCVLASVAVSRAGTYSSFTRLCTCGGVTMTFVGAQPNNNASGNGWVKMYILNGVAAGNQTITYTISSGAAITICSNSYLGVSGWSGPYFNYGNSAVISSGTITGSNIGDLVVAATSPPDGSAYVAPLGAFMYQAGGDRYNGASGWCDAGILETPGGGIVTRNPSPTGTASSTIYGSAGAWGAVTVILRQTTVVITGATVPAGIQGVWVTMIGPGGGGAGGTLGGNVGGGTGGAGGGGGGGLVVRYVPAAQLGSTYSIAIAPSGAGGWYGNPYVYETDGIGPTGPTTFTSGPTTLQVGAGTGGVSWKSGDSTTVAAPGGFGDYPGAPGGVAALSVAAPPGVNGGSPAYGGAGGGGGSTGTSGTAGGAGGNSSAFGLTGGAGGVTGSPMGPGADGPSPVPFVPGAGAGGGSGNPSANIIGARGGWGMGYGAGGGAGGVGNESNGEDGGLGGAGGPGFIGLVWDYR